MRNFKEILIEIVNATNRAWCAGCSDKGVIVECATKIYIEEMKLERMK